MSYNLTPLQVCERLIGPLDRLSAICGLRQKAGYLWRKPAKGRDAGDFPAARHQRRLLAHAAARGIPLTADHLIWGAPADEIDQLVAAAARPAVEAAE